LAHKRKQKVSKQGKVANQGNQSHGTIRAVGLILILISIASFLVNFGIFHPWLFAKITWLWNPLSMLTPRLVGHIWVLSSALAYVVNGIFAALYSAVLFVIGMFALLH